MSKNEQKNQCGKLKKIQDFCPRDIQSCHLAAARRVKLFWLDKNLFFKEIHLIGSLEQYLAENISLQSSNCIIFGLTDILALFANEVRFFRFRVFFRACSLRNDIGDPQFSFTFLTQLTQQL